MNRSDVIVRLAVARGLLSEQAAPTVLGGYGRGNPAALAIEQWMVDAGHLAPLQAASLRDDFLATRLQCTCGWIGSGRDTGGDRDGGCPQCRKASDYWPLPPDENDDDAPPTIASDRMPDLVARVRPTPRIDPPPPPSPSPSPSPPPAPPRPASGIRDQRPISGDDVQIPHAPDAIPPGTMLGDWRVEERVGAGAIGFVYRATDVTLDRPVAIKVLTEDVLQNPTAVARFKTEARALARLDHPNVLQVYRFGHVGSRPYLAMQWVDGESLAERIKRAGHPDPDEAARWLAQAAQGLAAAHSQGIVHRDVKPENLMLTRAGQVKVADFGLAREVDSDVRISRTGAFMGTPAYVAPEQIDGSPDLDGRADVYSLGATAFELLTGQLPFHAKSLVQLLYAHTSEPVPSLRALRRDIPPNLENLVQRMMAKQPDHRPDMAAVATAFERLASGVIERDDSAATLPSARYEPPGDEPPSREAAPGAPARPQKKSADYYQLQLDDRDPEPTPFGRGAGAATAQRGPLTPSGRKAAAPAAGGAQLAGRSGPAPGAQPRKAKRRRGCVGTVVTLFVGLLVIILTAALAFSIWWLVQHRRVPTMDDIEHLKFWEHWSADAAAPAPAPGANPQPPPTADNRAAPDDH